MNPKFANVVAVTLSLWAAAPASRCLASYHFMQIEKIVAGVNGDTSAQAVQLRMRVASQGQLDRGKLVAFDAAGENPVVIIDFQNTVRNASAGDRILVNTISMRAYTDPPAVETFTMERPIPDSYLAAGSLIFVNDEETLVVWRISWGGAAYTGSTAGAMTNDEDREFGPPIDGPLPIDGLQVLEFLGDFDAKSTSNVADYQLSAEPGTLTNNSAETFTLIVPDCDDPDGAGPDSDNDSIRDACDGCPDDADKSEAGLCGCGVPDTDTDGTPDCHNPDQGETPDDGNVNDNTNSNDNPNANGNDNVPDDNTNDNGEPDPDNTNGNSNDNSDDSGNDNIANGNDNGGGSSPPRGCSPGVAAIFAGLLGLFGLRSLSAPSRFRRGTGYNDSVNHES